MITFFFDGLTEQILASGNNNNNMGHLVINMEFSAVARNGLESLLHSPTKKFIFLKPASNVPKRQNAQYTSSN